MGEEYREKEKKLEEEEDGFGDEGHHGGVVREVGFLFFCLFVCVEQLGDELI